MSSMVIEESFSAGAPRALVYAFLRDPAKCFPCLPGATYGGTDPATGKFDGTITVRVGPLTIGYDGWATYEQDDPAAGRLVIKGQGREKSGAGIVKMDMTCEVTEADGRSTVKVVANVGLAGQIVRLGRGMIHGVSAEVFKEFATRATAQLEAEAAAARAAAASPSGRGLGQARSPPGDGAAAPPPPPPPPPPPTGAPANGLAIFFRALGSMLSDLVGRWFGRRS